MVVPSFNQTGIGNYILVELPESNIMITCFFMHADGIILIGISESYRCTRKLISLFTLAFRWYSFE
jgi:hypothetical protein